MRYTSPTLEKIWKYGFVDVGELNFSSASYTARYILKKIKGWKDDYHYMTYDLDGEVTFICPEFVLMSRGNAAHKGKRCGIGAAWYEKYKDDVFPGDEVPVPGHGMMPGVPRYYDDILKEDDPDLYDKIKEKRLRYLKDNKDEFTFERLMDKHICAKAKLKLKGGRKLG